MADVGAIDLEKTMSDDSARLISRRDLLRGAAGVGAVAFGASSLIPAAAAPAVQAGAARAAEAFETLTATEAGLLETVVERLVPTDATGPGAREARVAHYIDRALGGALSGSRQAYASGLAALDRYAQASRGRLFAELPVSDQNAVLSDCESGRATGFARGSAEFLAMVLNHTRQGMFGDPFYGGNANFVGWELIGYPGVRTMVSGTDQKQLEAGALKTNHKSAYDYDVFT